MILEYHKNCYRLLLILVLIISCLSFENGYDYSLHRISTFTGSPQTKILILQHGLHLTNATKVITEFEIQYPEIMDGKNPRAVISIGDFDFQTKLDYAEIHIKNISIDSLTVSTRTVLQETSFVKFNIMVFVNDLMDVFYFQNNRKPNQNGAIKIYDNYLKETLYFTQNNVSLIGRCYSDTQKTSKADVIMYPALNFFVAGNLTKFKSHSSSSNSITFQLFYSGGFLITYKVAILFLCPAMKEFKQRFKIHVMQQVELIEHFYNKGVYYMKKQGQEVMGYNKPFIMLRQINFYATHTRQSKFQIYSLNYSYSLSLGQLKYRSQGPSPALYTFIRFASLQCRSNLEPDPNNLTKCVCLKEKNLFYNSIYSLNTCQFNCSTIDILSQRQQKFCQSCEHLFQPYCKRCNKTRCLECMGGYFITPKGDCNIMNPYLRTQPEQRTCWLDFTTPFCTGCDWYYCLNCSHNWTPHKLYNCYCPQNNSTLVQNLTCVLCKDLYQSTYCLSCNRSICLSCQPSFTYQTGICICPVDSIIINDICFQCRIKYGNGCSRCDNIRCNACELNFILNSICICPSNAYIINDDCRLCSVFYGQGCLQCSSKGCILCDSTIYTLIDFKCECKPGTFFNSSGQCAKCSNIFDGCYECNHTTCHSCLSMYQYYILSQTCQCPLSSISINQTCIPCQSLYKKNCKACNSTECTRCDFGTVLQPSNHTQPCIKCTQMFNSCRSCLLIQCLACLENFYLINNTCKSCLDLFGSSCLKCNNISCLQCVNGFHLHLNTCISCNTLHKKCIQCTSSCKTCLNPYKVVNSSCYLCGQLFSECIQCTSSFCLKCNFGSRINNGQCISCIVGYGTGCYDCSERECIRCSNSSHQTINNSCKTCQQIYGSQCAQCSSSSCLQCQNGKILYHGKCQLCSTIYGSKCVKCSTQGCFQCRNNSKLYNGTCEFCQQLYGQSCSYCSNNDCLVCKYGSAMQSGNCTSCEILYGSSCILCNDIKCLMCSSPSHLFNGTCIQCYTLYSEGCTFCSLSACLSCSDNMILDNGSCGCPHNSIYFSGKCIDCASLYGSGCVQCNKTQCTNCGSLWNLNPYSTQQVCNCQQPLIIVNRSGILHCVACQQTNSDSSSCVLQMYLSSFQLENTIYFKQYYNHPKSEVQYKTSLRQNMHVQQKQSIITTINYHPQSQLYTFQAVNQQTQAFIKIHWKDHIVWKGIPLKQNPQPVQLLFETSHFEYQLSKIIISAVYYTYHGVILLSLGPLNLGFQTWILMSYYGFLEIPMNKVGQLLGLINKNRLGILLNPEILPSFGLHHSQLGFKYEIFDMNIDYIGLSFQIIVLYFISVLLISYIAGYLFGKQDHLFSLPFKNFLASYQQYILINWLSLTPLLAFNFCIQLRQLILSNYELKNSFEIANLIVSGIIMLLTIVLWLSTFNFFPSIQLVHYSIVFQKMQPNSNFTKIQYLFSFIRIMTVCVMINLPINSSLKQLVLIVFNSVYLLLILINFKLCLSKLFWIFKVINVLLLLLFQASIYFSQKVKQLQSQFNLENSAFIILIITGIISLLELSVKLIRVIIINKFQLHDQNQSIIVPKISNDAQQLINHQ